MKDNATNMEEKGRKSEILVQNKCRKRKNVKENDDNFAKKRNLPTTSSINTSDSNPNDKSLLANSSTTDTNTTLKKSDLPSNSNAEKETKYSTTDVANKSLHKNEDINKIIDNKSEPSEDDEYADPIIMIINRKLRANYTENYLNHATKEELNENRALKQKLLNELVENTKLKIEKEDLLKQITEQEEKIETMTYSSIGNSSIMNQSDLDDNYKTTNDENFTYSDTNSETNDNESKSANYKETTVKNSIKKKKTIITKNVKLATSKYYFPKESNNIKNANSPNLSKLNDKNNKTSKDSKAKQMIVSSQTNTKITKKNIVEQNSLKEFDLCHKLWETNNKVKKPSTKYKNVKTKRK